MTLDVSGCSQGTESGETCGENVGDIALLSAIGAGVGTGIDALRKARRTIYEAQIGTAALDVVPITDRDRASGSR